MRYCWKRAHTNDSGQTYISGGMFWCYILWRHKSFDADVGRQEQLTSRANGQF